MTTITITAIVLISAVILSITTNVLAIIIVAVSLILVVVTEIYSRRQGKHLAETRNAINKLLQEA